MKHINLGKMKTKKKVAKKATKFKVTLTKGKKQERTYLYVAFTRKSRTGNWKMSDVLEAPNDIVATNIACSRNPVKWVKTIKV